jgi:hypothetical protein
MLFRLSGLKGCASRCRFHMAFVLAFAMLLTAHSPSSAQQPSAASINLAKELLELRGSTAMFDNLIPGVVQSVRNVFLQTNPSLSKDLNDVATQLRNEYGARRAELQNEIARVYVGAFSDAELRDAITFFRSPAGKKLSTEEPRVIEQVMSNTQNWSEKLADEILGKFRAEMRKRGHTI